MNNEAKKELLKKAFLMNMVTVKELSHWLDYLDGNPVLQSSTTDEDFLEFINEVSERTEAANEGFDKRAAERELNAILRGENITTN